MNTDCNPGHVEGRITIDVACSPRGCLCDQQHAACSMYVYMSIDRDAHQVVFSPEYPSLDHVLIDILLLSYMGRALFRWP